MTVFAYLRVSKHIQDLDSQRQGILGYFERHNLRVDHCIEHEISSKRSKKDRGINDLLDSLRKGDVLICSELSRLGRSTLQILEIIREVVSRKVVLIVVKQNFVLNGSPDIASKILITVLGLLAEVETDLISKRTKEGLALAKARGQKLGNPMLIPRNEAESEKAQKYAESMRETLEMCIQTGMTQRAICEYLNRTGWKTRRGKNWTLLGVQQVLRRLDLNTVRARKRAA